MSKVFKQVLQAMPVKRQVSSAYPKSQGALERFHLTLKSMLYFPGPQKA